MTKMRFRPGYSVSTKAHSAIRRGLVGGPARRYGDSDIYSPEYIPRSLGYHTRGEEYAIEDSVLRATSVSDAILGDTYNTSAKSRGRDQRLLSEATNAIVSSESYASPAGAVASRRVKNRPQAAPRAANVQTSRVVSKVAAIPASAIENKPRVRSSLGSRVIIISRNNKAGKPPVVICPNRASNIAEREVTTRPVVIRKSQKTTSTVSSPHREALLQRHLSLNRNLSVSRGRPRKTRNRMPYLLVRPRSIPRSPQTFVHHYHLLRAPRGQAKAALVASRVEPEQPRHRRRPRSQYAADKLRESRRPGDQDSYVPATSTAGLHASRPPLTLPSERKSIRDVDGFTKPKNVLSWQYRLESRMNPQEVMYQPGAYTRMREQVRGAHDKLDKHRQLLDRYLNESGEVKINRSRPHEAEESSYRTARSSGRSSSAPPAQPSQPAMSELRRRLRKTICKSKQDPNYYRE